MNKLFLKSRAKLLASSAMVTLVLLMIIVTFIPATETSAAAANEKEKKTITNKELGYYIGEECEVEVNTEYTFDATKIPDDAAFIMFKFTVKNSGYLTIHFTDEDKGKDDCRFSVAAVSKDMLWVMDNMIENYDYIEKGEYYLYFHIYDGIPFDEFRLKLEFETVGSSSEDGKAYATAFNLKEGKTFQWHTYHGAYYLTFTLDEDSVVRLYAEPKLGDRRSGVGYVIYDGLGHNVTIELLSKYHGKTMYLTSGALSGYKGDIAAGKYKELNMDAGTYYIKAGASSDWGGKEVLFRYEVVEQKDTTPPSKVSSVKYTSGSETVTCKGEVGATVWLTIGDKVYRQKTDKNGKCTIELSDKLSLGDIFYIWQVDKAANQGNYRKVKVK